MTLAEGLRKTNRFHSTLAMFIHFYSRAYVNLLDGSWLKTIIINYNSVPVVPHKAVAEVSKIGNL
jgi:hypothetical protein